MAVITINDREFPAPDIGGNLVVATNVSDGKNALAVSYTHLRAHET